MKPWTTPKSQDSWRLVDILKHQCGDSQSIRSLRRAIDQGWCRVNGSVERHATTKLSAGARIELRLFEDSQEKATVLYEDGSLLALNKPAGVTSESLPGTLVHRLDKDTSGVLLFAKTTAAEKELLRQFREREVAKRYLAIVDRAPKAEKGRIESRLAPVLEMQGQKIWASGPSGKLAITDWTRQHQGKDASLITCYPRTGRTHQIRVHMKDLKCPILGDPLYGKQTKSRLRPARTLLHAEGISFTHPKSGKKILLHAPIPLDFQKALAYLGAKSQHA